jgi:hypothetical protein
MGAEVDYNFSPLATNPPGVVYPTFKVNPSATKDNFALTIM